MGEAEDASNPSVLVIGFTRAFNGTEGRFCWLSNGFKRPGRPTEKNCDKLGTKKSMHLYRKWLKEDVAGQEEEVDAPVEEEENVSVPEENASAPEEEEEPE